MREESSKKFLKQASEFLVDARLLLAEDRLRSAADRIYYAFYWAAQAALIKHGIITKTHRGLMSQFGKEFVSKGITSREFFKAMEDAFEIRQESTYDIDVVIEKVNVEELLNTAAKFISRIYNPRLIEY